MSNEIELPNESAVNDNRRRGKGKLFIAGMVCAALLSIAALLVPAIRTARQAALASSSNCRMKQLGLSFHNFHDQFDALPPAISTDESGKPTLSWRVHLLPFLEEGDLYKQFRLNEPWDSPYNKALLPRMPKVFGSPEQESAAAGLTNMVAIVGDETVWPGTTATSFKQITDGESRTILVVEVANTGIHWTEPRDLTLAEFCKGIDQPGGAKSVYPGKMNCLYADGAARLIPADLSSETLRALATRAGKEPIVPPDF